MPSTAQKITPSTNTFLKAIEWGGWRWTDGAPAGTNITYEFDGGGTNLNAIFGSGYGISKAWTSTEKAAYRAALAEWSKVANISFTQVASSGNMVETIFDKASSDTLGVHGTPDEVISFGEEFGTYNRSGAGWDVAGLRKGGYGYVTIVHELGHALGLAHPHDTGGGSTRFPGVTADFGDFGSNNLNQGIFTVMSYNDGWETGIGLSPSDNYGWQSGPMAFDIAAIQHLYGAKPAATGSNIYKMGHVSGSPDDLVCIWDTGGTDTIKYSGSFAALIDLRAATLANAPGGGGFVTYVKGAPVSARDHWNAYTIAKDVKIENAVGGSGNDKITGNQYDNDLTGGFGRDTLNGRGGDDDFIFRSISESKPGPNHDIISSFSRGHDDIDLSGIDVKSGVPGNNSFKWISSQGFHEVRGELRYTDNGSTCLVQGDANGDGKADFEILVKVGTLGPGDFLL